MAGVAPANYDSSGAVSTKWFVDPFASKSATTKHALFPGEPADCTSQPRCLQVRQVCALTAFSVAELDGCILSAHQRDDDRGSRELSPGLLAVITIAVLAFVAVGGVVIYQRQQRRQQLLQQQQRQGAAGGRDRYSFRKDDASEYQEGGDGTSYVRMSDISHLGRYGDSL